MRRHLVVGVLVLLAALAGCSSVLGPGEPDQARLNENATYDWATSANASIVLNGSSFSGVYDVTNRSTLEVYSRDALGTESYLRISALRYRYPNGSVIGVNSSALAVEQTRKRTIIDLPNGSDGQVAFTAPRNGKRFRTPVFVEGTHEVTLPRNARVGIPLLSQVSPGDYRTNVSGNYMTVYWDDVTSRQLSVRWYLERDVVLFTGVIVVAVTVGSGGALYYYRQIRRLQRRRDEVDIDVDDDDIGDRGPPPGMR